MEPRRNHCKAVSLTRWISGHLCEVKSWCMVHEQSSCQKRQSVLKGIRAAVQCSVKQGSSRSHNRGICSTRPNDGGTLSSGLADDRIPVASFGLPPEASADVKLSRCGRRTPETTRGLLKQPFTLASESGLPCIGETCSLQPELQCATGTEEFSFPPAAMLAIFRPLVRRVLPFPANSPSMPTLRSVDTAPDAESSSAVGTLLPSAAATSRSPFWTISLPFVLATRSYRLLKVGGGCIGLLRRLRPPDTLPSSLGPVTSICEHPVSLAALHCSLSGAFEGCMNLSANWLEKYRFSTAAFGDGVGQFPESSTSRSGSDPLLFAVVGNRKGGALWSAGRRELGRPSRCCRPSVDERNSFWRSECCRERCASPPMRLV